MHTYGDGVKVFLQLVSGGAKHWGYSYGQEDTGLDVTSLPRETVERIVEAFGKAAGRVQKAGYDGVQLHGGHGYLISQFISPAINQRTDKWGGSVENRARFPLEIYRSIRKYVGDDFPVGIKMNTRDYLVDGLTLEQSSQTALLLAEEGFALIEISGGMGYMTELREVLRKRVGEKEYYFYEALPKFVETLKDTGVTLAICGGIRTPSVMEDLLDEGADIISMARPYLCEPDLPNRIKAGDSRPSKCVSAYTLCNLCLYRCALDNVTCVKFYEGDCEMECPIKQQVPTYVSLIAQGKIEKALGIIKQDNPIPGILGRVCQRPCESLCRGSDGEPIAIRDLKRFASDYGLKKGYLTKATPLVSSGSRGKVAIIGSGPAGLTCAYNLAMRNYEPTIFEKMSIKGGAPAAYIPEYRLPNDVLQADIDYIESAGVTIETSKALGKDFFIKDLLAKGYKAIFVATGTHRAAKIGTDGEDAQGVIGALDFLSKVKSGERVDLGDKVVVIGGGSVAIDVVRTAVRLGSREVNLICLESKDLTCKDRMPAQNSEIEEAEEEGVVINPSLGIAKISTVDGKVVSVETKTCTSVIDAEGNFTPEFGKGVGPNIAADTVIIAVGQQTNENDYPELEKTSAGTIKVDPVTLETSLKGVFAGGDVISGPRSLVDAVKAGKEGAESIDRFMQNWDLRKERVREFLPYQNFTRESAFVDPSERISNTEPKRQVASKLPVVERKNNFKEVALGLTEEQALTEAKRCLKYDLELEEKSAKRKIEMKDLKYDMSVYGKV